MTAGGARNSTKREGSEDLAPSATRPSAVGDRHGPIRRNDGAA